jgi:heme A synthase
MIDSIIIPPFVHLSVGSAVLLTNTIVLVVAAWLAFKKQSLTKLATGLFILFQLVLMIQALIGVKLLDQGLGPLQLYIHYLGGLAPLFFCLLYYWLPAAKDAIGQSRRLALVAGVSLFFVVLTFTVGSIYVAGGA